MIPASHDLDTHEGRARFYREQAARLRETAEHQRWIAEQIAAFATAIDASKAKAKGQRS